MDRLHVDYNIGLGVDEVDGSRCPRIMALGRSSTSDCLNGRAEKGEC